MEGWTREQERGTSKILTVSQRATSNAQELSSYLKEAKRTVCWRKRVGEEEKAEADGTNLKNRVREGLAWLLTETLHYDNVDPSTLMEN